MKKFFNNKTKRAVIAVILAFCLLGIYAFSVNLYVILSSRKLLFSEETFGDFSKVDYIMVLGCGIKNNEPSDMLKDRLNETVKASEQFTNAKIIVSGDNSGESYNEVGVMKKYLLDKGVKEERILEDNIGFSTYESMYNLKNIFKAENPVVITQKFHIPRAVYIGKSLGINITGLPATPIIFTVNIYSSFREIFARNKDFLKCAFD